ncbi:phage holin family protein [Erwinia sp. BNK-24-b]|uniref:phage holin family protein n=1 Tax=Erwinia TaxID=551 RepID=UPI001FEE5690|nr:phage holin family protein [Erwinia phyllosphaerae]MBV4366396.1 phage holin family protein [Erwinia phyllosphaerae]
MVTNDPMVIANVVTCSAIALRLMFFRKPGAHHEYWASWLAYMLVLAYGSIPFRYFFDHYDHTNWASLAINLVIAAAVFRSKGNVAIILAVLRPKKSH